jgi:hypothetical protein
MQCLGLHNKPKAVVHPGASATVHKVEFSDTARASAINEDCCLLNGTKPARAVGRPDEPDTC